YHRATLRPNRVETAHQPLALIASNDNDTNPVQRNLEFLSNRRITRPGNLEMPSSGVFCAHPSAPRLNFRKAPTSDGASTHPSASGVTPLASLCLYIESPFPMSIARNPNPAAPSAIFSSKIRPGEYFWNSGSY